VLAQTFKIAVSGLRFFFACLPDASLEVALRCAFQAASPFGVVSPEGNFIFSKNNNKLGNY